MSGKHSHQDLHHAPGLGREPGRLKGRWWVIPWILGIAGLGCSHRGNGFGAESYGRVHGSVEQSQFVPEVIGARDSAYVGWVMTTGDFDGDNIPDLVVGGGMARGASAIDEPAVDDSDLYLQVFRWSGQDFGTAPVWSLPGWRQDFSLVRDHCFLPGRCGVAIGDFNGDGFDDLVGVRRRVDNGQTYHEAALYLGSDTGLASDPQWTWLVNEGDFPAPVWLLPGGDFDGDGVDDFALLTMTEAYVFWGDATAPFEAQPPTVGAFDDTKPRSGISPVGDLDGDGWAEFAAITYNDGIMVWTVAGGTWQVLGQYDFPYPALHGWDTTSAIVRTPDIDGDGVDELWVSMPIDTYPGGNVEDNAFLEPPGMVFWYDATLAALADVVPKGMVQGKVQHSHFGEAVAFGDFDGDGATDLAVGAPRYNAVSSQVPLDPESFFPQDDLVPPADHTGGQLWLFPGVGAGQVPSTASASRAVWLEVKAQFGATLATPGDIDADGYDDLLVAAPNAGPVKTGVSGGGAIYLLRGAPDTFDQPAITVWGPTGQPADATTAPADAVASSDASSGDAFPQGQGDTTPGKGASTPTLDGAGEDGAASTSNDATGATAQGSSSSGGCAAAPTAGLPLGLLAWVLAAMGALAVLRRRRRRYGRPAR